MLLVLRRLPLLVALLAAISAAMFALTQYLPGDPAFVAAGGGDATPEMVAAARARLGLDRPLWVRYLYYMRNVAGGDFGNSIVNRRPVIDDLKKFWPASMELALAAIAISALVGIPLGVVSASWSGRWPDRLITPASVFLGSMPVFWLGLMAVFVFYRQLDLLPAGGRLTVGLTPPPGGHRHARRGRGPRGPVARVRRRPAPPDPPLGDPQRDLAGHDHARDPRRPPRRAPRGLPAHRARQGPRRGAASS